MQAAGSIRRGRRAPAINIVPLVDVLTVLVFFFMVTMQFKTMSALN
ncbi:MAG: ExbD/TolR family protein, partial [Coraliomargarita sp.]